jgi:hypothetical protein
MKRSITLAAAVLALAAVTLTCTSVDSAPVRGGDVYLVGVAGGG